MAGQGVHFALTEAQARRLLTAPDDRALMTIVEEIEDLWDEPHLLETDRSWQAIHRSLTEGDLSDIDDPAALAKCIPGGRQLYNATDHVIGFSTAAEVAQVAAALATTTQGWLYDRYIILDFAGYVQPKNAQGFDYVWSYFEQIQIFYQDMAEEGRAMLFAVDV